MQKWCCNMWIKRCSIVLMRMCICRLQNVTKFTIAVVTCNLMLQLVQVVLVIQIIFRPHGDNTTCINQLYFIYYCLYRCIEINQFLANAVIKRMTKQQDSDGTEYLEFKYAIGYNKTDYRLFVNAKRSDFLATPSPGDICLLGVAI